MRKVILHIGRHKTGSTAIQNFLFQNRLSLFEHGFEYPLCGIRNSAHHELGETLTRASITKAGDKADVVLRTMRHHLDKAIEKDDSVLVISSEAFQNCDPKVIRKFLQGFEVHVIVYIREPVSYLLSAYAQKVQASDYCGTLEDFYHHTSQFTYKNFLDTWESAFGSGLTVMVYDRAMLAGGNVVVDFCHNALNVDGELLGENCSKAAANPSLTQDLLDFKLWVNKNYALSASESRLLFSAMARLAGEDDSGGVRITDRLARKIELRHGKSNRYVACKYFNRDRLFVPYEHKPFQDQSSCREAAILKIREQLIGNAPEFESILPLENVIAHSR